MLSKHSAIRKEFKYTFILAVPMAGTQLAQVALQFIDTLMCGQLGTLALAGVSLGSATLAALLLPLLGLVAAVAPLAAQAYGAQNSQGVRQAVQQGLIAAGLLTPITMFALSFAPPILLWMGNPADSVNESQAYLMAVRWSVLPALLVGIMRAFLDSLSRPRCALLVALFAIGMNMLLNWLLMFGHWGFPSLGVAGTGWATTGVNSLSALALGVYIFSHADLREQFWGKAPLKWELFQIGAPMFFAVMAEVWLFASMTFLMGQFGTAPLAANQIALNLSTLTFMFAMGVSNAATVRVGQFMGRKSYTEARRAGGVAMGMGMAIMSCSALIFWLAPEWLIAFFIDLQAHPETTLLAVQMLKMAAIFQVFDALQVTSQGALRGVKDTFWPMLIGFACYWGVGLGSSVYLAFFRQGGPLALWQGLILGLMTASLLLSWRFFGGFRKGFQSKFDAKTQNLPS